MTSTQTASLPLPGLLRSAVDQYARAYGLNAPAATLLLLQSIGAIAGGSITAISPNMINCTPAFDLAAIHEGRCMLNAAMLSALKGAIQVMVEAAGAQDTADTRKLFEKKRKLMMDDAAIAARLDQLTTRIEAFEKPPEPSTSIQQFSLHQTRKLPAVERAELIQAFDKLMEDQQEVNRQLVDLNMTLHPGIIREGGEWRQFPDAGCNSFDGHFVHLATANSLIAETGSKSNRLRDCAELIQRSRSESPIIGFAGSDNGHRACIHLTGAIEEVGTLMHHARIKKSGMLDSIVLCDCDSDQGPDADALMAFEIHEWHNFMANVFRLRAYGRRTALMIDGEGLKRYLEFRDWCWESNRQRPVEQRIYFLQWPELMMRIATSLALIDDATSEGVLEAHFMAGAITLLKDHAAHQAAVLGRLVGSQRVSPTRLDEEIEKLVQRLLVKGPQTKRDLARGIHGQNYGVIDFRLAEAMRRGVVIQRDGRYWAAGVSVNASTAPGATDIGGDVAA